MKGSYRLVLSITATPFREMYAVGIFKVLLTDDVREATNYYWYGPLKYIALRNFKKSLPKWMGKQMKFKKILMLSGIVSGLL
jgi:hypothetical protein